MRVSRTKRSCIFYEIPNVDEAVVIIFAMYVIYVYVVVHIIVIYPYIPDLGPLVSISFAVEI